MKQKANLTAIVELGTLMESIEELHKHMANTEATLQQIRDEQIETKALFDEMGYIVPRTTNQERRNP